MTEIPKTCKAAVLDEWAKPIVVREVAVPEIEPGAVLVKLLMTGICGSDLHQADGTLGLGVAKPPFIMGHESIAEIAALGEGRTTDAAGEPLKVGDRIMWAQISCYECYFCVIENDPVRCDHKTSYGFRHPEELAGGYAEYQYLRPVTKVIKVPEELTNEEAIGIACAGRSFLSGYEKLGGIRFQENVVIQGAGPVGLYATVVASESDAAKVIVVDSVKQRLELAKKWGADHVIDMNEYKDPAARKAKILELTNGRGPEVVIECAGVAAAFNEGIDMIQKGGRYLLLGVTGKDQTTFAPSAILQKNMTVYASMSANISHWYKGLQFVKNNRHKYPFADMITAKFSLNQANEAIEYMRKGKGIKPVIDFTGR
jgi:threonine dehydrogenase-like Zn-dependent dehydrogenase